MFKNLWTRLTTYSPHATINWIILILFVAVWATVPQITVQDGDKVTMLLEGHKLTLWHVMMTVLALAAIVPCLHLLEPDKMIVGTFNQEIFEVYAGTGGGNRGILDTGIVFLFPPILTKGYIFPLTVVTVPITASGAMTREGVNKRRARKVSNAKVVLEKLTPVTAFLGIQFRLAPNIEGVRAFVRVFPVLSTGTRDLTAVDDKQVTFFIGMKPEGTADTEDRPVSCLARIIRDEIQSAVAEATSRAIAKFVLTEALLDWKPIETKILGEFPGTVLDQAHMLPQKIGEEDQAACSLFDFNVKGIIPSDVDTAMSLSAETKQDYTAKGKIAAAEGEKTVRELQGEGDKSYLDSVAAAAHSDEGKLALQAQMFEKMKASTTIVGSPNMLLDAAAARIVQQPTPPAPPTPPPTTP